MTARALTAFLIATVAALAAADVSVQVLKGVTPLLDEKPNTFRVDLTVRVVEEMGEDTELRHVTVVDELPEQLTLVRGELTHKVGLQSVEYDAPATAGWASMDYVVRADKVRFTLANQSYNIMVPPSRVSVLESDSESADSIATKLSDPVVIVAKLPLPKATIMFANLCHTHAHVRFLSAHLLVG